MRQTANSVLLTLFVVAVAGAEDPAVLKVEGRGFQGNAAYDGGGVVRFLDASTAAQLVHYDGGAAIGLPLEVQYDVIEPAPILLTSRMGTEYWRLYNFENETMSAVYTDEKISLAQTGRHLAKSDRARFATGYGPLPSPGLVGFRGHHYFLVDQPDGKWLDVVGPPPFFDRAELARKLTFTLTDLSKFSLSISEIQSTWESGGPFRVRLVVTDAQGRVLPVVGAPITAGAGDWQTELATHWGLLDEPTGWMCGELPAVVPEQIALSATVTVQTPEDLVDRGVTATFRRGDGRVSREEFDTAEAGYELPRNAAGTIRETRAIWVSSGDVLTAEKADLLVDRCRQARLNTLVVSILVRNTLVAKSDLMPMGKNVAQGFDPLGYLIEKAHAAKIEVHPWFCVTYRDRHFRSWFHQQRGVNVDMIDKSGKPISLGADVHRPEYRDFMVGLMIGVARDYPVDGIHLDYIRTMGHCYCEQCRSEFARKFNKPLADATDEEWIAWQRGAIGEIVQRTAEGVRRARPQAIMSAAVFSSMSSGAAQGQDPGGWANRGWIDVVMPMDYQMQTLHVRSNERHFLAAIDDDTKLATGLSLYMRSGTDVMSRPPELVQQQIELVRRMKIHGYCLFAFSHLSDEQLAVIRDELNPEPAAPYFR